MTTPHRDGASAPRRFRLKLFTTMTALVVALAAAGVYFGDRSVLAATTRSLQADFQAQLDSLHQVEEQRRSVLTERCRNLATKPRLHAAIEDNALDLLYPTAKDELRDLMGATADPLHARFYRFLDSHGAVITPPANDAAGDLPTATERQLNLPQVPATEAFGYVIDEKSATLDAIAEVFTAPIVSTETGEPSAALVVGFSMPELGSREAARTIRSGIWLRDRLWFPASSQTERTAIERQLRDLLNSVRVAQGNFSVTADGVQDLAFYKQLNAGSVFPPAYEICVYPLTEFLARRGKLRQQILGGGALLLALGLLTSEFTSRRLVKPVEELAGQTEAERTQRKHAETALASTNEELQRSARFSADASHQLKSPVAVLRAGIESLLARPEFAPEVYDELSSLLHQTYRLTGIVNDLLLLSRMDAGRLRIQFQPVDLSGLIEEWLEDFGALPDQSQTQIETQLPPDLQIVGEKRYVAIVLQNLLENARKYNRAGGKIRVMARRNDGTVAITIGNSGRGIPAEAQARVFERFHRGAMGEDVPGHGLGLNLARELARLHGGDLRLVRSGDDWTEFSVWFRAAPDGAVA